MKTLQIRSQCFVSPLALAPMAGYTDIIWRHLLDELGGVGYMVTELISAEAICRKSSRTQAMIGEFKGQTPQFVQLFSGNAQALADAARVIENETGFAGIDINIGCPARKVVRKGAGSGLLKDLANLAQLMRTVRAAVKGTLTAKIRLGLTQVTALETVKVLQDEGVDAIAVHFRLQKQGYNTPADWSLAPQLKEILHIPLLGNGDVLDVDTARQRLLQVDGLLMGRASMTDPLLFARLAEQNPLPDMKAVIGRFFELIEHYLPPERWVNRIKAQARFLAGRRPGCRHLRRSINESKAYDEVCAHTLALIAEQEKQHE